MQVGWSRPLRFALLALLAVAGLTCEDVTFEPGFEVRSAMDLGAFVPDVQIVPFPAESLIIELRRTSDSSVAVRRAFATDSIEIQGDVDQALSGDVLSVQIAPGQSNSPTTVALGGIGFEPVAPGQTQVEAASADYISTQQATVAVTVNP